MVEDSKSVGTPPAGGTPPERTVTVEDLKKLQSIYDTKIEGLTKELVNAQAKATTFEADLKLVKEGSDEGKALARERELRQRLVGVEERERKVVEAEQVAKVKQVAAEAKAAWGVEFTPEELAKMSPEDIFTEAIRRSAQTAKKPPESRRVIPLTGTPGKPELRYEQDDLVGGLERLLAK